MKAQPIAFIVVLVSTAACSSSDPPSGGSPSASTSAASGSGGGVQTSTGSGGSGLDGTSGGTGTGGSQGGAGGSGGNVDGGLPPPPIDPAKDAKDLSVIEKGQLCDWMAELHGGYDKVTQCVSRGSVRNYKDQAECLAAFGPNCDMVVRQFIECQRARLPLESCIMPTAACMPWWTCQSG